MKLKSLLAIGLSLGACGAREVRPVLPSVEGVWAGVSGPCTSELILDKKHFTQSIFCPKDETYFKLTGSYKRDVETLDFFVEKSDCPIGIKVNFARYDVHTDRLIFFQFKPASTMQRIHPGSWKHHSEEINCGER